jgi:GAF domain-containing protein
MEEKTGRLKFEIAMGVDASKLKDFYLEPGEGIAGWVCLNGKPVVIEDVQKDQRFSPRVDQLLGFTTRSVVCVPLLNGNNRVVGAIELINKIAPSSMASGEGTLPTNTAFTERDMAILSSIGVFTGIAAENAFLHQKVR